MAVLAAPKNLQAVKLHLETLLVADLLLKSFNHSIAEFYCAPALDADQMVVMPVTDDMFVNLSRFPQPHGPDETAFDQQLQHPVDGGPRDVLVFCLEHVNKLVGVEVAVGLKNGFDNIPPLGGSLELVLGEILLEHLIFVGHGASFYD